MSCVDYLATLSEPELRCWVRLNLSYEQVVRVGAAIRKDLMNEGLQEHRFSNFIIRLCAHYDQNELRKVLAKEVEKKYQFLPDNDELEQIKLDLINKVKVENLATLDLSCLLIRNLPNELFALSHLEHLYLAGNLIESLPDFIYSLSSLKTLDLYKNNIFFLSPKIGQLLGLESLYLSNNQLGSVPSQIGYLSNLQVIDLHNNQLSSLPSQIGFLSNLRTLLLSHNNFSNLPDEIGLLFNLQGFSLSYNKLTSLPTTLNCLFNLQLLSLSDNKLTNLPNGIGLLSNLQFLDLSYNNFTGLLSEVGNLHNLQFLSLSNNNLSSLPSDIRHLTQLKMLMLRGNNSLLIPPEILALFNEPAKILNYYFDVLNNQQETRKLNEAKMLVVGEGKIGKTSLVNRLVDDTFNDPEPMTEGVIIKKHWPVKLEDGREIKVNVWDFGGQEIMHSTHQFFLTKRSLYLLVLDSRQDEQPNRLDYWLKTIESFAEDSPIIIVCNQIDVKTLELDQKTLKAKYPNIKAFASTSCRTGKGVSTLKEIISEQLRELKHVDDQLLASWFKVKEELENLQKENKDYLEYSEYQAMCKKENVDTSNEETLIGFLHDLGIVLCFHNDLRLRDTHILNPEWVTTAVYKILNYRGLAIDKGELKTNSLDQILNDSRYPRNKYTFITDMMRKFKLCFDLDASSGDKLLIPDLLPKEAPELGRWDDSLRLEYHYELLPNSVISRFIVETSVFIYGKTYWRYGVVLESEDKHNKALVKADLDAKKIFIFVNGRDDSRKNLLSFVRANLRKIHNTIPKLQFEQKIPLTEDPQITVGYQYLMELLDLGEKFVIPPGLKKKIPISPLLDGLGREPNPTTNTDGRNREIFSLNQLKTSFIIPIDEQNNLIKTSEKEKATMTETTTNSSATRPDSEHNKTDKMSNLQLIRLIEGHFNRSEVKVIWFELFNTNLDDDLSNQTLTDILVEMISRCNKQNRFSKLVAALIALRPDIKDKLNF